MSNAKTTTVQVGPGGSAFLTALFVILKVTGYISWSWLWVLSPMWIPAALVIAILIGALVLAVIAAVI